MIYQEKAKNLVQKVEEAGRKGPRHFTITTQFLRETCYPYLMGAQVEVLAYLSGVRCRETTVIDQLVTFRMDIQNTVYVRGDQLSTADALIMLDERGFLLEGTIHCHPGYGESATHPSHIDYAHHRRLETGGYRALGVIMTRDGFVRFYTTGMPFEVTVLGTDAVLLSPVSYRLALDGCDPKCRGPEQNTQKKNANNKTEDEKHEHDDIAKTTHETEHKGQGETDAGGAGREGISDGSAGESPRLQPGSGA